MVNNDGKYETVLSVPNLDYTKAKKLNTKMC